MKTYRFDEHTKAALSSAAVPIGVYQVVDGQVVTLIASDGLCELFGYKNSAEAIEMMDRDMYWNVHPDDLERVVEIAAGFIREDKPYNLVCRVRSENGYRLIHTRGRHVMTETGERLAVVWYIDEGAVLVDAAIAQDEETIETLRASMHTLLNNMPVLSFSKNVEDGRYLACNQMFAEYAHRKTPAGVVGLTDHDIFDAKTADHFVTDDKIALSMDEAYSFFEDAPDAVGNPRQFRTTKLKFIDEAGRLCLLGMSMDVSDLMRARQENEQAKAAYRQAVSAGAIYESIVNALSEDYFDLYYVDVQTGAYVEYGSRTKTGQRTVENRGDDFFAESQENAPRYIYEEDLARFQAALDKETLLGEIKKHGAFRYHYRLLIDGVPTYVSMKATSVPGDARHAIIGVSNVDSQVKDRLEVERASEERKSYLRLSALNGNLIVLYYVDPERDNYTEFSSSAEYRDLGIARQGSDFFKTVYTNSLRMVHPKDQGLFHAQVTKENILATIERDGVFMLDYRLMSGDLPTYVRLKAVRIVEDGKPMLIIGLLDEDAQIRQEQEYARKLSVARKMAVIDSLTGVKNKHAYVEWEEKINARIEAGDQEDFAVAICDINSLKAVNDLYGHAEGDLCIKNACAKICGIFCHSPVFRIGGDEFAVLLFGSDYYERAKLMKRINALPADRSKIRIGETVSAGMAEYRSGRHHSLQSVAEEADKAMYERKQFVKAYCQTDGDAPGGDPGSEYIPAIHGRRHILIADDIESNREILGELLMEDYDVLYASDGIETMDKLRFYRDEIALVILDLYMPKMTGREVLTAMQLDEELMSIPAIVLTVDQEAELDCLRIGAMDFIPKPFPDIEIVKARIAKCIELSEDRVLIRHAERDKLTGLLNRDFFYRYVRRLDQAYRDSALDALVCDVNRLRALNERYGRQFGDFVLRGIGAAIRRLARKTGGIGCRQGGDTFLLYCPHRDDWEEQLRRFPAELLSDQETADRVSLRFGVFSGAQQEPDIEERFIRAKNAADAVANDPQTICGYYEFR